MNPQLAASHPWYRELWPWLLMAGPAAVIVAGVFTAYLAVVSNDGLVADDYYKRGLAINQTLARDAAAQKLNCRARVEFEADYGRVHVSFASSAPASDLLVLRLAHAGRPALDRLLPLTTQGGGTYAAAFPALTAGRWQVTLEDTGRNWRLVGDMVVPGRASMEIAPR
jgi:hypothetical protein